MFQCPITLKPLQGLCLWGSDGFIYNYSTLPYFERKNWYSPITRKQMAGLYGADIMLYAAGTCIIRSREEDIRVLIRNNTTDGGDPAEDILINYIPAHEQGKENEEIYDEEGYDEEGYGRDGYDDEGYNRDGYDAEGYSEAGFYIDGYDRAGYDAEGYGRDGYDDEGYNRDGYNAAGFNRDGRNRAGFDRAGYDRDGYDDEGYNRDGYDSERYNRDGYDRDGYNRDGYNGNGFDRMAFRRDGYDLYGHDKSGRSRKTNFQNGLRSAEFDLDKIKDPKLYTRYMWASCPIFRNKYGGWDDQARKRIQNKFDKRITPKKFSSDFDRGLAEGLVLWTIIRNEQDIREEIIGEFKRWRSHRCAAYKLPSNI